MYGLISGLYIVCPYVPFTLYLASFKHLRGFHYLADISSYYVSSPKNVRDHVFPDMLRL